MLDRIDVEATVTFREVVRRVPEREMRESKKRGDNPRRFRRNLP